MSLRNTETDEELKVPVFRARQVDFSALREEKQTQPVRKKQAGLLRRVRWGLLVVLTLLFFGCYLFWNTAVVPWWNGVQDQWNYGSSRVTQLDADVGHGGVSHFLAEYYRDAIVVIEIDPSDLNHTHIYTLSGMIGGNENTVVLLSVEQGSLPGKPNLLIQVKGSLFQTTLYNTGTAFSSSEGN